MPKVKQVVLAGLLLAMLIVFQRFLPLETQFLRISFSYVPLILIGTFLGPVWGAVIGVAEDLLGMLLMPRGSFFPGFTLNALLIGIIYGGFLHNRPNNKSYLIRLVISVITVHVVINIGLTTLWLSILYKRAFMALIATRIIANAIQVPIQIGSMFAIKIFLDKPAKKYLMTDSGEEDDPDSDAVRSDR
jgi:ECF transporter S component (folate family)